MGPNGMNKMVINHLERLFVTSDARTIVTELEVQHPAGGRLSLHFEVSHSSYAVAHERVHWVVRNLPDAVADVSCAWNGSGGNGETSDVAWSHSVGDRELRVTAPLGHSCVVGI